MNTQATTNTNANKDERVQSALDSIAVIRQMMDRSEVNLRRLGALFLVYGLINLAHTVCKGLFGTFYINSAEPGLFVLRQNSYHIIINGLAILAWAVMMAVFFVMRSRIRRTESRYTMKLFDMWGAMMFLPPVLELVFSLTHLLPSATMEGYMLGHAVFCVIQSAAVCICLLFTGHYTDNWAVKMLSLALLLLIPVSCVVDLSWLGTTAPLASDRLAAIDVYQYLSLRTSLIMNCILMLVYIIIGVIYLVKREGKADGTEQYS